MPFPDFTPTMPILLRTAADRHGPKRLLVADGEELSYAEADTRSRELAKALLARGVGKGDHVGILMPNSVSWAVAWFATTRIGAVAVPINTFFKARELAWVSRHADLASILTTASFLGQDHLARLEEALPGLAGQATPGAIHVPAAPFLRTIAVWGDGDRPWATPGGDDLGKAVVGTGIDDAFLAEVEQCVTPADPAVILYTSGSTGDPKGPVHSHGTLVRHTYNLTFVYRVEPGDVMFTSMPFFWVGGLITGLHAVLHHGATLVTQPAFEPGEALDLIEAHAATITLGWPQQGTTLAEHPTFAERDLSSIRRTSMPAMVPPERRPPAVRSDSLGMSELCGNHLGVDPYLEQPEARRGTFGPSVDGLTHRIVDPDTGEEMPTGEVGEIWARGYSLMQGLHKREREESFTADGYYRTGDAGRRDDDGWVYFTARLGDMIKTSGGTNVTPGEVETALTAYPEVLEAYVTGMIDGDHGNVVVAAVVPAAGAALDAGHLRRRLRDDLSAYKVPKHVWVCAKSELPFTDSGKIKKADLATMIAARVRRTTERNDR